MALFKKYRNKASGDVYNAMSSPDGYEDAHPAEWEPIPDEAPAPRAPRAVAAPALPEEPVVAPTEFPPAPADFVPPLAAIPPAPRRS